VSDDVVDERCVRDGGVRKLLAGDGGADDGKDAGADDSADAERGQRPRAEGFLEGVLRVFRVPDELVDRLAGKQLAGQVGFSSSRAGGLFLTEYRLLLRGGAGKTASSFQLPALSPSHEARNLCAGKES
jgi:hypothetical protein